MYLFIASDPSLWVHGAPMDVPLPSLAYSHPIFILFIPLSVPRGCSWRFPTSLTAVWLLGRTEADSCQQSPHRTADSQSHPDPPLAFVEFDEASLGINFEQLECELHSPAAAGSGMDHSGHSQTSFQGNPQRTLSQLVSSDSFWPSLEEDVLPLTTQTPASAESWIVLPPVTSPSAKKRRGATRKSSSFSWSEGILQASAKDYEQWLKQNKATLSQERLDDLRKARRRAKNRDYQAKHRSTKRRAAPAPQPPDAAAITAVAPLGEPAIEGFNYFWNLQVDGRPPSPMGSPHLGPPA